MALIFSILCLYCLSHGGIIRMETAWGNSAASSAEAGIVGFPQSPKNIRSKRLRKNKEMV